MGISKSAEMILKIKHWESVLREAGIIAPEAEVCQILEMAAELPAGTGRLVRLGGKRLCLTPSQEEKIESLIQRRREGEPLQYLLGCCDFFGRSFLVGPGVLIPRFDTEILVQTALETLQGSQRVLDLCAGSGCIGLTLAAETGAEVVLLEKSPQALFYLQKNAARLGGNVKILCQDVLNSSVDSVFDMIVSNPPYIPCGELPFLPEDVQKEPRQALDGGPDGLLFYRDILSHFSEHLCPEGRLLFDCGWGQGDVIAGMMARAGYSGIRKVQDYSGVERVICGVWTPMEGVR